MTPSIPQDYTRALYDLVPRRLAFDPARQGASLEAVHAWQEELRAAVADLVWGDLPRHETAAARVEETRHFDDHTRHVLTYQALPGLTASAYLLVPHGLAAPAPGLIAVHGHGVGVAPLLEDPGESDYHQGYARQAVRQGYVVFAPEILGFGPRRDPEEAAAGSGASSCRTPARHLLLFGTTLFGVRLWESVLAGVDLLAARPEVDAACIGVMGISMGGMMALFGAALDTRIAAAVVSGYFNTFRDSILSIPHCEDNYVPGLLRLAEMSDLAGLIAPRPLLIESGTDDAIFPVDAARNGVERLRKVYAAFGGPEFVAQDVFGGGHQFSGALAWEFLARFLKI